MRSRLSASLAVAIMVSALVLSSCTTASSPSASGSPAAAPTSQSGPAATPTPTKPYGSFTAAVNFGRGELDPQIGSIVVLQNLSTPIFDYMISPTPDGQMSPGIAERWEIAADGMTHTFYIRKGVKFHDGSDLTGADVKFSFDRMLLPEAINPDAAIWRTAISSVSLKDEYTVILNMKTPQFELIKGFADFYGSTLIVPKKYIEEKGVDNFRKQPVGSGPFKVVKWTAGSRLELEANENYWGAVPQFKNVTLLSVSEEATKVAMLKTGELDIAEISPDSVAGLKSAGLSVLNHDGAGQLLYFSFYDVDNVQKFPLNDVKVRKALSLAIDRKELADKFYSGYAQPSYLFSVSRTGYFYDANVMKPDPLDLEGAKKLLADAGYPNGTSTKLWDVGGGNNLSLLSQALEGYWRKAGVTTEVTPIEYATLTKRFIPKPVPEIMNSMFVYTGAGVFNYEGMQRYSFSKSMYKLTKNSKLDELIDKVPAIKDPAEKKKAALDSVVLAHNEYSLVGILDIATLFAVGPKVGNVTPVKSMTALAPALQRVTHAK